MVQASARVALRKVVRAIARSTTSKLESAYCISAGYHHREAYSYFDDTSFKDEWQREVYLFAKEVMNKKGLRTVYDVGCGSAFKLVKYLGEFDSTGFDVDQTVEFLRRKYPERKWISCDFSDRTIAPADLVICSDVIEHVLNPDELVGFVQGLAANYVIFSTPDRDLMYPLGSRFYNGPPSNSTHIREWNSSELKRYLSRSFNIIDHRISNWVQSTQMVFCQRKIC